MEVNPLKEIEKLEKTYNAPTEQVIILTKQADGNWIGKITGTNGRAPIEVRDIGPETVLQRLLTHE